MTTVMPSRDADDLDRLLFRQRGVISRHQALRHMPASMLRRHLANRRWQRAHRAVYVAHNGPLTGAQRTWVGVLFAGHDGTQAPLAGISALGASGLRGYDEPTVHIYLPASCRGINPPRFVRVHRTRVLTRADVAWSRPPRTGMGRSVIDAAMWACDDDRARAIIAASFQQRLVTLPDVLEAASRMRRISRRDLIMESARDAAGGSESVSELEFLRLCRRGGLPLPTRQSVMVDARGRRRYRDAYFEEWSLHVEIDGSQHMDAQSYWADMQRQNDMWTAGDRVLRFPAWVVRHQPEKVIAAVRAALIAAGWRP